MSVIIFSVIEACCLVQTIDSLPLYSAVVDLSTKEQAAQGL